MPYVPSTPLPFIGLVVYRDLSCLISSVNLFSDQSSPFYCGRFHGAFGPDGVALWEFGIFIDGGNLSVGWGFVCPTFWNLAFIMTLSWAVKLGSAKSDVKNSLFSCKGAATVPDDDFFHVMFFTRPRMYFVNVTDIFLVFHSRSVFNTYETNWNRDRMSVSLMKYVPYRWYSTWQGYCLSR